MVVFCPLLLKKSEMQNLCSSRGKACLLLFPFERPLLQNCIMHSSICTNGYFLSYYIDIHAWDAAGETCYVSNTTCRGRPRLQPVRCDQCTFLTFDPKRFNYCWMDKMTSKSIFFLIYNSQTKKLESWTFTK